MSPKEKEDLLNATRYTDIVHFLQGRVIISDGNVKNLVEILKESKKEEMREIIGILEEYQVESDALMKSRKS